MELTDFSDDEILALTIIGEARGEPIEGQVAVGCIIRNRLHSNEAYKNYSDVCLETNQFSCWNANDPNRPFLEELGQKMLFNQEINDAYIKQCIYVAHGIVSWSIMDNTGGSKYYMTMRLFNLDRPKWAKNAKNQTIKGKQVFFDI